MKTRTRSQIHTQEKRSLYTLGAIAGFAFLFMILSIIILIINHPENFSLLFFSLGILCVGIIFNQYNKRKKRIKTDLKIEKLWKKRNADKNFHNHHNYYRHTKLQTSLEKKIFYRILRKSAFIIGLICLFLKYLGVNTSSILLFAVIVGGFILYYTLIRVKLKSNVLSQKIQAKNIYDTKDGYMFFY